MSQATTQKKLEDYSYKINRLVEEMKYYLNIPSSEVYKDDELKSVDANWSKALSKLKEAKHLIETVLKGIAADSLERHQLKQ